MKATRFLLDILNSDSIPGMALCIIDNESSKEDQIISLFGEFLSIDIPIDEIEPGVYVYAYVCEIDLFNLPIHKSFAIKYKDDFGTSDDEIWLYKLDDLSEDEYYNYKFSKNK